jgi:hypothetical protein
MMSRFTRIASRFRKSDDGNATVEFVVFFTVFFIILATGVEIAYMNMRHTMLERGVDLVTRDIRLATGHIPGYAEVRTKICDAAAVVDDCEDNLRLEMVQVDPMNFVAPPTSADCQNAVEDPRPVRSFVHGQANQLMLIRACLKFKPMMPTTALGKELLKDEEGYAQLIVTSAFVQEPR